MPSINIDQVQTDFQFGNEDSTVEIFLAFPKSLVKQAFFLKSCLSPTLNGNDRNISGVILQYHSVVAEKKSSMAYISPSLSVSARDFDKQMLFMKKYYQPQNLTNFIKKYKDNAIGHRCIFVVSFDDGYRDNYIYALPILKKYNIQAIFYLTVDCIDKRPPWPSELRFLIYKTNKTLLNLSSLSVSLLVDDAANKESAYNNLKKMMVRMNCSGRESVLSEISRKAALKISDMKELDGLMLTWKDVHEMRAQGMEIGSHTLSHPSLPFISLDEADKEIRQSKDMLERALDAPVEHFSYPNPGDYLNFNKTLKALLEEAGYLSAATSVPGHVHRGDDPWALRRKGIYRTYSNLASFNFWVGRETSQYPPVIYGRGRE